MALDLTYAQSVPNIINKADEPHPPSPLLYLLTTEGLLIIYSIVNSSETQKYPDIAVPEQLSASASSSSFSFIGFVPPSFDPASTFAAVGNHDEENEQVFRGGKIKSQKHHTLHETIKKHPPAKAIENSPALASDASSNAKLDVPNQPQFSFSLSKNEVPSQQPQKAFSFSFSESSSKQAPAFSFPAQTPPKTEPAPSLESSKQAPAFSLPAQTPPKTEQSVAKVIHKKKPRKQLPQLICPDFTELKADAKKIVSIIASRQIT